MMTGDMIDDPFPEEASRMDLNRQSHDRAAKARENLVNALRQCGDLADAVATFEGTELLEVLDYLDSLRFVMAESGQLLQGVVRGEV
jgi:hypothetical protein